MTWTYLLPRSSTVAASPAPTKNSFSVATGQGNRFVLGPAWVNGDPAAIKAISGDAIALVSPLALAPTAGAEVVQTVLDFKDKVRLFCGDTDTDDQQLQDEEILAVAERSGGVLRAAATACLTIAAKLSRKATYTMYQEIQEKLSDQSNAYRILAAELRRQAARSGGLPYAGGILQTEKDLAVANPNMVTPFFTRLMFSEPGTEPSRDLQNGPPLAGQS